MSVYTECMKEGVDVAEEIQVRVRGTLAWKVRVRGTLAWPFLRKLEGP